MTEVRKKHWKLDTVTDEWVDPQTGARTPLIDEDPPQDFGVDDCIHEVLELTTRIRIKENEPVSDMVAFCACGLTVPLTGLQRLPGGRILGEPLEVTAWRLFQTDPQVVARIGEVCRVDSAVKYTDAIWRMWLRAGDPRNTFEHARRNEATGRVFTMLYDRTRP